MERGTADTRRRERLALGLLAEALYELATLPDGRGVRRPVERAMATLLELQDPLAASFAGNDATAPAAGERLPA